MAINTVADKTAHCMRCGHEFQSRRNTVNKYCSRECGLPGKAAVQSEIAAIRRIAKRKGVWVRKAAKPAPVEPALPTCYYCGAAFVRLRHGQVSCSDACSIKGRQQSKRLARQKYRRAQGNKWRHTARRFGVEYEPVNVYAVFDRDGWRCQICGKPTPKERRGKRYSNAPELDHRVPISQGGPHTMDNVQCACRQCNSDKGNASNVGQMPLIAAAHISI